MAKFKNLLTLVVVTGVAGLLLLIAAQQFEIQAFTGPGLLLFAAGVFAAGLHIIIERYVRERRRPLPGSVVFTGTAAVLIGIVTLVLASAFAITGVAFLFGLQNALFEFLLERPGVILVPLGLAATAAGGARILGAEEWGGSLGAFLLNLPERIGGVFLLVLGALFLSVGTFELVTPDAFDSWLGSLLEPLNSAVPR